MATLNNQRVMEKQLDKLKGFDAAFAKIFIDTVSDKTPVKTGNLRDAWFWEDSPTYFIIGNSMDYASFVEDAVSYKYIPSGNRGPFMLQRTLLELDTITEKAVKEVEKP